MRDAQRAIFMPIHEQWLMVWQGCQGLGKNKIRKLVTRRSRKEVCSRHFQWAQSIKIFMSHMKDLRGGF